MKPMKLLTAEGRLLPLTVMFFFTLAATGISVSTAFADGSPGPVTAGAPVIELAQAKKDELLDKDDLLLDTDKKDAAKPEKKDKKEDEKEEGKEGRRNERNPFIFHPVIYICTVTR